MSSAYVTITLGIVIYEVAIRRVVRSCASRRDSYLNTTTRTAGDSSPSQHPSQNARIDLYDPEPRKGCAVAQLPFSWSWVRNMAVHSCDLHLGLGSWTLLRLCCPPGRRAPAQSQPRREDAVCACRLKAAHLTTTDETLSAADPATLPCVCLARRKNTTGELCRSLTWQEYFMAVAFLSAQRSKDPSKQVGACIVGRNKVILGIGYNGFPRGCGDHALPWAKKSKEGFLGTKYPYVVRL